MFINMPITIKIYTIVIFIGINLKFATENLINALIFSNILQSGNPYLRYDIHTPSIPDMYGDAILVVIFAIAYLLITSIPLKKTVTNIAYNSNDLRCSGYLDVMKLLNSYSFTAGSASIHPDVHQILIVRLKNHIRWIKAVFYVSITGIGLYLFSKYILSICLEVLFFENNAVPFILNSLNDITKLCSSIIFTYAYCSYFSTNKIINFLLYAFFFIRNFFTINSIGLITDYDLHVIVPFLDFLTPIIIVYSLYCIAINYKKTPLFKMIGIQNNYLHNKQSLVFPKHTS